MLLDNATYHIISGIIYANFIDNAAYRRRCNAKAHENIISVW